MTTVTVHLKLILNVTTE